MSAAAVDTAVYLDRMARIRAAMVEQGIDTLLLSVGHDLPYLTGYTAMPLERLTMLVVPRDGDATMIIPRLEAPRVVERPGLFTLLPWGETEDPTAIVGKLAAGSRRIAVGDQMWARFLVELLPHVPGRRSRAPSTWSASQRMTKDQAEIDALAAAGAAVDRIAGELQRGEIPLVGRTEAQVSAELSRRIVEEGHDKVNFAIVAAGENAASPHHHASDRVIGENETRAVRLRGHDGRLLLRHHAMRVHRRRSPPTSPRRTPCCSPPSRSVCRRARSARRARRSIGRPGRSSTRPGYGDYFIHRTGHGIGMEEHEDPYIVEGNALPLAPGHAYSVEPGIYVPGKWGMRLEDIVVATADGPGVAEQLRSRPHQRVISLPARSPIVVSGSDVSNAVSSGKSL